MSEPKEDGGYGIGKRVPISTCHVWVTEAIRAITEVAAADLRNLELQRLDELQSVLYASVMEAKVSKGSAPTRCHRPDPRNHGAAGEVPRALCC
jgi:hypothetical protein